MKTTILFLFILFNGFLVSGQVYSASEKIIIERMRWIYKVKEFAALKAWPEFGGRKNDVALAYFTETSSYIVDPGGIIAKRMETRPFYKDHDMVILRTAKRIDKRPFHMETSMDTEDSSAIFFNYPVMCCSDYETTVQTMPQVNSLQEWISMVIHEYFHGFQLKHRATAEYGDHSIHLRGSQIDGYYKTYTWFKASVDKENELLLSCLQTADKKISDDILKQFRSLRETRRTMLEDTLKIRFSPEEDFYEKLEGTAKYTELKLLESFKQFPVDQKLKEIDTAYKIGAYQNFNLMQEKWMYETGSMHYFYATGFNLLRVLDKLKIPYKKNFFDDNGATPYTLLTAYIQKIQ